MNKVSASVMLQDQPEKVPPFLKWAGGKRWLTTKLEKLAGELSGTYFEPFLGSGAAFFSLKPACAVLSDLNKELIEAYNAIKEDWKQVEHLLEVHQLNHSLNYYYHVRDHVPPDAFERAARFIYLNRTCWNGLYRVNQNGVFNVPIGTKSTVLMDDDNFGAVAKLLSNTEVFASDFQAVIARAKRGDVIFADPPYTVRHNLNGFVKYNEQLFAWSDQVRLRDALREAKSRGARVIVTNADHSSIRELYRDDFLVRRAERFSPISGARQARGNFSELLIVG